MGGIGKTQLKYIWCGAGEKKTIQMVIDGKLWECDGQLQLW